MLRNLQRLVCALCLLPIAFVARAAPTAASDANSTERGHRNVSVSASEEKRIVSSETVTASASGIWNISPGEDGYRCGPGGLANKPGSGRCPLPGAPYGALIYREDGAADWHQFQQGMTFQAGVGYTFRVNDTDLSNEGALTITLE